MALKNVYVKKGEIHIKTFASLEEVFEVLKNSLSSKKLKKYESIAENKVNQVPTCDANLVPKPELPTEDVKKISYIGGFKNRALKINKILYLIEKMSEDGDLTSPELIVSPDSVKIVGDGQHRCLAAYFLGYKIQPDCKPEDSLNKTRSETIRRKNSGQKNWSTLDYERFSKAEGSKCAFLKEEMDKIKPRGYPENCVYTFITGKYVKEAKNFAKKPKEEKDELIRMHPNAVLDDFEVFCDRCLKKLEYVFETSSYIMFEGFTKFAAEDGFIDLTYTGFLDWLDNHEVLFKSKVGPDNSTKWKSYFTNMYNKYLWNTKK